MTEHPETTNQSTARAGERLAAEYLTEEGWEILARNWSCKIGEIDIVAYRDVAWGDETVVQLAIVEVKTSAEAYRVKPERHVDQRKRRKLVNLAKFFLAESELRQVTVRFDVIGVTLADEDVRHYPAAFDGRARLRC